MLISRANIQGLLRGESASVTALYSKGFPGSNLEKSSGFRTTFNKAFPESTQTKGSRLKIPLA